MNTQQQYEKALAIARRIALKAGITRASKLNLVETLLCIENSPQFCSKTDAIGTYIPDGGTK